MPILPEHKEILLSQNNSETLPKLDSENSNLLRQNYFKTWSENMAYILGIWYAVGHIYENRIFDITIHKKDKYIIKRIANELNYNGNLLDSIDKQINKINFSCKIIYNDIINLGGKENKDMISDFPNVPKEFLPDFIRGFFDGNGFITNIKGNRLNSTFIYGNKKFLLKLLKILKKEAGVQNGSFNSLKCVLKFGDADTKKIGIYMYKNNPELFLLRKRKKFKI